MLPEPSASVPPFPRVPWRKAPLLLLAYAAAIALLAWPGSASPATHVLRHWDPPFHAWKLAFAARTLLAGHVLPPWGDTNLYYPHSGAFFFEALHWPQAVFAAPLLAAGLPETAVYHVTLVFFWALSGVLFWAWLRALGLRGGAAAAGGLFFTVLPYRMSYAVEFNMQLVFGLPLLLFALVRFFQRPGFRYAALGAVAWWLQAASELYQAVFVLFAFPFWVLPLLVRDPALLRSWRRFRLPVLAAAALCAALSLPFLLPYARTLGDGSLVRSLDEMREHALEPFSYLLPWGKLRFHPAPDALQDEMSVFPTLSLAILALGGILSRRRSARNRPAVSVFAACCAAAALSLPALHFLRGAAGHFAAGVFSWSLLAAVAASFPWMCRRDRSLARAAAIGTGAAALFGLAMGFGPDILDTATGSTAANRLFRLLHAAGPALSGFRVVSRFSVFPTIALCASAAVGFQAAADALARRPRLLRAAAAAAFFAVFLGECLPATPPRFRPIRDVSSSAAIAAFDALPDPGGVLAIVPMGKRDLDSEHMLAIERTDRLGVWAWGGAYPRWTVALHKALATHPDPRGRAAGLLRELWPEAFVLEDRRPFPGVKAFDWAGFFGPRAALVAEDPAFRLFRILPDTEPATETLRRVRADFVAARPRAVFTLCSPSPARVWLDFNGVPLASFETGETPGTFSADVPEALLVPRLPQRYRFHAEGDAPFVLADFRLEPLPAGAARPAPPAAPWPDLPWTKTFAALPPEAVPLSVRYPGGLELRGVQRLPGGGKTVPLRFFFRFAKPGATVPARFCSVACFKEGEVSSVRTFGLRDAIDAESVPVSGGRLVAMDAVYKPSARHKASDFDLAFELQTPAGRATGGRTAGGKAVKRLFLPFPATRAVPPWLESFDRLPASATPLAVRYPGGIALRGAELLSAAPLPPRGPGERPFLPVRFYLQLAGDAPHGVLFAPGYARDGAVRYKCPRPLHGAVRPEDAGSGRLVAVDAELPVPRHLASGETYGLSFDLEDASGRRLDGRDEGGKKVRHLFLPLTVTLP